MLPPPHTSRIWGCSTFAHPRLYHETRLTDICAVFGGAPGPFPVLRRAPTSPAAQQGANQTQGMRRIRAPGRGGSLASLPCVELSLTLCLCRRDSSCTLRGCSCPDHQQQPLLGTGAPGGGAGGAVCAPTESMGSYPPTASPCPHRSPCRSPPCGIPGTQSSTVGCVPFLED